MWVFNFIEYLLQYFRSVHRNADELRGRLHITFRNEEGGEIML